jgi:hypothetical protein
MVTVFLSSGGLNSDVKLLPGDSASKDEERCLSRPFTLNIIVIISTRNSYFALRIPRTFDNFCFLSSLTFSTPRRL